MMSVSLLSAVMNLKALAKKTDLTMKKLCLILAVSSARNIFICCKMCQREGINNLRIYKYDSHSWEVLPLFKLWISKFLRFY